MWHHFFPLLFPKDSESLKILDIRLREVGEKRPLNGTSRSEHTQTDRWTDKSTYRKHLPWGPMLWKSRIRETKHLSTDADSSTDTTIGWTKKTQKPKIFEKGKNGKTLKCLEICQYYRYTLRPEVSNPLGSVVSTMFCKAKSAKHKLFLCGDLRPLQMWDHWNTDTKTTKNVQFL